jgi:pheromone shutdown protein TraB
MMTIICTALFKLKVDHLSVVMISACSWITALNPLCAIFIVGPYRDAILRRNRVSDIIINTANGQRSNPTRNTAEMTA